MKILKKTNWLSLEDAGGLTHFELFIIQENVKHLHFLSFENSILE